MLIAAAAVVPEPPTAYTLCGASFVPAGIVTEIAAVPVAGTVLGEPVNDGPVALSRWNVSDSPPAKFEIVPVSTAGSELMVGEVKTSVGVPTVTVALRPLSSPVQLLAIPCTE